MSSQYRRREDPEPKEDMGREGTGKDREGVGGRRAESVSKEGFLGSSDRHKILHMYVIGGHVLSLRVKDPYKMEERCKLSPRKNTHKGKLCTLVQADLH